MIKEQKEFNKSLLMEDQEKWKLKKKNYLEKDLIILKKES
jgi:hypothetical protein